MKVPTQRAISLCSDEGAFADEFHKAGKVCGHCQPILDSLKEYGSQVWYEAFDAGEESAIRKIQSIAEILEKEGGDPKFVESMQKFANLLSK